MRGHPYDEEDTLEMDICFAGVWRRAQCKRTWWEEENNKTRIGWTTRCGLLLTPLGAARLVNS